jgi:hypothetical protein
MKKFIMIFILIIIWTNITFAQNNSYEVPVCQEVYKQDLWIEASNKYYNIIVNNYNNYLHVKEYSDWKKSVIYNWVESKKYDNIWLVVFSEKWHNYAYKVAVDWKWIIIKNWEILDNNSVNVKLLTFSEDWSSFSYATEKDWKWYIVKDWNIVSKWYHWINYIFYSDENNVLYDWVSDKNIIIPTDEELSLSMVNSQAEGTWLPNRIEPDIYINSTKLEDYKWDDTFYHSDDLHLDSWYFKVINWKLQKVKNKSYYLSYVNNDFIDFSSLKYYSDDKSKNSHFDFIWDKIYFYENDKLFNEVDNSNSVIYLSYFSNNNDIYYVTYLYEKLDKYSDYYEKYINHSNENIKSEYSLKSFFINDKKVNDFNDIYNIRNIWLNKIEILARTNDKKYLVKLECDASKYNYADSRYIWNYETYNNAKKIYDWFTKKIESKTMWNKIKKIELYKNIIEKLKPISVKNELNWYIYRFFVDDILELIK